MPSQMTASVDTRTMGVRIGGQKAPAGIRTIDVDRTVFARVIDLQDPVAQALTQPRLSTIS
jgi:hypothetical protein